MIKSEVAEAGAQVWLGAAEGLLPRMGGAKGDPDPGGGEVEGRVTWELVGDGQALVTLRGGAER